MQKESQSSFLSRYLLLIILVVIASFAGAGIIFASNYVSKEIEELKKQLKQIENQETTPFAAADILLNLKI